MIQDFIAQYRHTSPRSAFLLRRRASKLVWVGTAASAIAIVSGSVVLNHTADNTLPSRSQTVKTHSTDAIQPTPNTPNSVTLEAALSAEQDAGHPTNNHVTVNGQPVAIPNQGSIQQTIPGSDGSMTEVTVKSDQSSTNNTSRSSIRINSHTTSRSSQTTTDSTIQSTR